MDERDEIVGFSLGALESKYGAKADLHVRSSIPLFRAYTNDQIHPLFVEDDAIDDHGNIQLFENICQTQVNQFIEEYTAKEGTFVPLPLLYGFVSEQILLHQERHSTHPLVEPYQCTKGQIIKEWEKVLQKNHPEVLQTVFNTPLKSEKYLKNIGSLDSYGYLFEEPKVSESDLRILDNDMGQDFIERKLPYLPLNIYEPPHRPTPVYRGSALRAFYSVRHNSFLTTAVLMYCQKSGELFLLHAGGSGMNDLLLSKFTDHKQPIHPIETLSCPRNVPGEIYQIEIQHKTIQDTGKNRIAIRYMYHCMIVDIEKNEEEFLFRIIECLMFPSRLCDVRVSKYTGEIMIWPACGDLFLWDGHNLRTLYKRDTELQKIQRKPVVRPHSEDTTIDVALPLPANCLCTFTSHPKVSISTEGTSIYSLDFREKTTYQRPLYIIEPFKERNEILGLRYDFENPFYFAVNTSNNVYLFDERYVATPVKEWSELVERDPCHNLEFLGRSNSTISYAKNSVVSWTESGRTIIHPYDTHDKTWKSTILSHQSEPGYSVAGFSVNTDSSYVGMLHSTEIPYHVLSKKRFNRELSTVGHHMTWLSSVSTSQLQEVEDQLVMIQLSRFGDIYSECFDFQITPSLVHTDTEIWFDAKSRREQVKIRKEEKTGPTQREYYIYDVIPFLHDIIQKSHRFIKPKKFEKYLVEKAPRSQFPPAPKIESDPESKINEIIEEINAILEIPRSLFDLWNEVKDLVTGLRMKILHKYLIAKSTLLAAFSFQGEQRILLEASPAWKKIRKGLKKRDSTNETKFYVWCLSNIDIDVSLRTKQEEMNGNSRLLNDSHVFGFSVMYCSKESWDDSYGDNYRREQRKGVSSMAKKTKEESKHGPTPFEPGDYSNWTGYRTNRATNIPAYTRISRADYGIDFVKLRREWNISVPRDVQKLVGDSLSQINTPLSGLESTPKSQVLTGSAAIRRPTGLSQLSMEEKREISEIPSQGSPPSSQSQISSQATVAPSQEDMSMLFSLLGGDESD